MFVIVLLVVPGMLAAVETAPRIYDREIIEGLANLNLKYAEIKAEFKVVHERFDSVNRRFESFDKRFESIDKRFESIDKRFESIDRRLSDMTNILIVLFGSLITLIVALFGYIAWDRQTSMRPIEKEVRILKQDLEIQRKTAEGITLVDVLQALREAAKNSPPLKDALRNASLL